MPALGSGAPGRDAEDALMDPTEKAMIAVRVLWFTAACLQLLRGG